MLYTDRKYKFSIIETSSQVEGGPIGGFVPRIYTKPVAKNVGAGFYLFPIERFREEEELEHQLKNSFRIYYQDGQNPRVNVKLTKEQAEIIFKSWLDFLSKNEKYLDVRNFTAMHVYYLTYSAEGSGLIFLENREEIYKKLSCWHKIIL